MDVRPVRPFLGANYDARIANSRMWSSPLRIGNWMRVSEQEHSAEISAAGQHAESIGSECDFAGNQ